MIKEALKGIFSTSKRVLRFLAVTSSLTAVALGCILALMFSLESNAGFFMISIGLCGPISVYAPEILIYSLYKMEVIKFREYDTGVSEIVIVCLAFIAFAVWAFLVLGDMTNLVVAMIAACIIVASIVVAVIYAAAITMLIFIKIRKKEK